MTARSNHPATEPTPQGEQMLVPGVRPTFLRPPKRAPRIALLLAAPMRPRAAQKPLAIGLIDNAKRNQLDLF